MNMVDTLLSDTLKRKQQSDTKSVLKDIVSVGVLCPKNSDPFQCSSTLIVIPKQLAENQTFSAHSRFQRVSAESLRTTLVQSGAVPMSRPLSPLVSRHKLSGKKRKHNVSSGN